MTEPIQTENAPTLARRLSLRVKTDETTRPVVLQALQGIAEPTRVQPDCRVFEVFSSAEDPNTLLLVEEWENQEAMNTHIRSRDFRVVLSVIDMSREAPSVALDAVIAREALALLTEPLARNQEGV